MHEYSLGKYFGYLWSHSLLQYTIYLGEICHGISSDYPIPSFAVKRDPITCRHLESEDGSGSGGGRKNWYQR